MTAQCAKFSNMPSVPFTAFLFFLYEIWYFLRSGSVRNALLCALCCESGCTFFRRLWLCRRSATHIQECQYTYRSAQICICPRIHPGLIAHAHSPKHTIVRTSQGPVRMFKSEPTAAEIVISLVRNLYDWGNESSCTCQPIMQTTPVQRS